MTVPVVPPPRSAPPLDLIPAPKQRRLFGWLAWAPIVLGSWLAVSPVLWPHMPTARTSFALFGLGIAAVGALAMYKPWVSRINAGLAIWLGLTSLVLNHYLEVSAVNGVAVAALVLVASLIAQPATSEMRQSSARDHQ